VHKRALHSLSQISDKERIMPAYEVYVLCNDCGSEHPLLMKIHLDHGPDRKQSIAESFGTGPVPPQVQAIKGHNALCLKTGKKFKLENYEQVLLVPSSFFQP
jgi:hypothetical protein